jgi:hypothetical protein
VRVEYTTQGGSDLGGGLRERETSLRIDLANGVALVEHYQPSSEQGGEALGTFKAGVPPDLCANVREAVERSHLNDIRAGSHGGLGTTILCIRAIGGVDRQETRFSNRDVPTLTALQPLIHLLDEVRGIVIMQPLHAVTLGIKERRASADIVYDIAIKNVGTEAVALPGLLSLSASDPNQAHPQRWLGARIAAYPPERPGFTALPLAWSHLALAMTGGEAYASIILESGATTTCQTRPWVPSAAGRHLVQATFAFYAPPAPLGPPLIRGCALSPAIEVEP